MKPAQPTQTALSSTTDQKLSLAGSPLVGVTPPMMPNAKRKKSSGRSRAALLGEKAIELVIRLCGISAIVFVFGIFFFVFREGAPYIPHLNLGEFLGSTKWYPSSDPAKYGVGALLIGTLSVTFLAMFIAVPFGLGAAVFVSEFCQKKTKETLKIVIELLAAIPSVVWGFIGMSVLGPIIKDVFHVPLGVNMFNAALLLALMSVPIMVSIGEDALKAVPDTYREAALALGATKWQTVFRVLLPAAKNGLLAAVLLGVGRAIGETMAVLMATGHSARIPKSIFDPVQTLTATIAAELGEARQGSEHYQVLFLIGVLLFTLTFIVNLTADLVVKGIRKK
ncbi:MAG TPA: phosphate ABC transporter permease subunit PstC [Verrucomicrobiae bacterium]|jgi:phosphate transport system permease protein